jgi:hypothetical protein
MEYFALSCFAVGTMTYSYYLSQLKKSYPIRNRNVDNIIIQLSPIEENMEDIPSISTFTLYEGFISSSEDIHQRVFRVIEKNSWLTSDLHYENSPGERHLIAEFSNTNVLNPMSFNMKKFCEVVDVFVDSSTINAENGEYLKLFRLSTLPEDMTRILKKKLVKKVRECVISNMPLFKVILLKLRD